MTEHPTQAAANAPATDAKPAEHRDRTRVIKRGIASYADGAFSHPCIIRNVSPGGARLRFHEAILLPKRFTLVIELDHVKYECEIAWQLATEVGVRFTSEAVNLGRIREQELAPIYDRPEPGHE